MGFRSFVGRGLLMSFLIVGGLSMVLYPHEYVDDLNLISTYSMNGKFGFTIDPKPILDNSHQIIMATGTAVVIFGSLAVLGSKFAAFVMLVCVMGSSWLFFNPLSLETETKRKTLLAHLVYNLVIIAGLLQVILTCQGCRTQSQISTKVKAKIS